MNDRKLRRVVETSTPLNLKNRNDRCSSLRFEVSRIDKMKSKSKSKSKSLSDSINDETSSLRKKEKSEWGVKRKKRRVQKIIETSSSDEESWETTFEQTSPTCSNKSPEVTRDAARPEDPILSLEKPIYPFPIPDTGNDEFSGKNRVESNSDSDDCVPINVEKFLPGDRHIRNRYLMLETRNFDPNKVGKEKKKMGKGSSKIQKEIGVDDPFAFPTVTFVEPKQPYKSVHAVKEACNPEIPQKRKRGTKRTLEPISTNDRDRGSKRKLLESAYSKTKSKKTASSVDNEKLGIDDREENSRFSNYRSLERNAIDPSGTNIELSSQTSKSTNTKEVVTPLSQIAINYASPIPIENSPKQSPMTISIENRDPSFVDCRVTKRRHRRIGNLLYPPPNNKSAQLKSATDPISNTDRPSISRNITLPMLPRIKNVISKHASRRSLRKNISSDEELRTVPPIASNHNATRPSIVSDILLDGILKRADVTRWLIQTSMNNLT